MLRGRHTPSARAPGRGEDLEGEARRFSRYLIDADPSSYVVGAYARAHRRRPDVFPLPAENPLDRALLAVARRGRFGCRVADVYSRVVFPGSVLRRKLALLIGILESTPTECEALERPTVRGPAGLLLRLAARGAASALALAVSLPLFVPSHLASRLRRGRDGDGSPAEMERARCDG